MTRSPEREPFSRRLARRAAGIACAALVAGAPSAAAAAAGASAGGPKVFHVPGNLFAAGGPLGALQIEACRIVLADGPGGSLVRVSPAMARLGIPDLAFTLPPLEQDVDLGLLATTLRLKIPGGDAADPATTIQSARVATRVAGAALEMTVVFESLGPELTGEYYGSDPGTGKDGWIHVLDVEADELTIKVAFPILAQGAAVHLGAPAVAAAFSFAVAGRGWAALALDGTFAKDTVKAAIERAVADVLQLEAYRAPLAAAVTTWLREVPFQGLALREIRLRPAADGGLELLAITTTGP